MSNNKLPARVDTHLPLAQLPVNPPTFTTALNAHVRMKVSEVLQKRMNAIALLRLDFQRTQVSIGKANVELESTLAEWDDVDNIVAHQQAERENARANAARSREIDAVNRETAVELARIEAANKIARARAEQQKLNRQLGRSEDDPAASPMQAQLRQQIAALRELKSAVAEWRHIVETDSSIAPSEKEAAFAEGEAMLRARFQQQTGVGGNPGDDTSFNHASR